MATRIVRSTARPSAAGPTCAALLAAVLLASALVGSRTVGAANTESTGATVSVPPAVHADLKEAQADLAKLDKAIAGEEKQQRAAESELRPWKSRSGTTPRPMRQGARSGLREPTTWQQRLRGCSTPTGRSTKP